ncbi:hypothetical protein R6Q59_033737 [Mikania micrantha]
MFKNGTKSVKYRKYRYRYRYRTYDFGTGIGTHFSEISVPVPVNNSEPIYEFQISIYGVDELVDWAITRGRENGYVLLRLRSKTNATGVVIKLCLECNHGGMYKENQKLDVLVRRRLDVNLS